MTNLGSVLPQKTTDLTGQFWARSEIARRAELSSGSQGFPENKSSIILGSVLRVSL